jgi:protein required for attachment to host cells
VEVEDRNWIIVADESAAEFYVSHGRSGPLTRQERMENAVGHARLRELQSDSPGRSFDSHGQGRHAMSPNVDKKETAALRFADEVIDRLVDEIRKGHVVRYSLVAAPRFMGLLRKALQKHSVPKPEKTLSKDFVGRTAEDIAAALSKA